jgi:hypothetical protein
MDTVNASTMQRHGMDKPDEVRNLPKTRVEVFNLGGKSVMRVNFEPGWKWSECVKPTVGTDLCQVDHFGYVISGRCTTVMADGTKMEMKGGDLMSIPAGHDAWVEGDEPFVCLDFVGALKYGK